MKNNNIIYAVLALGAIIGIYFYNKKDEPKFEELPPETPALPAQPVKPTQPAQPAVANVNLVLKFGSKGIEVQKLQTLLGAKADGIFGAITENLLFAKKGVKQISLSQYNSKPDVPKNPMKIGDKAMANKQEVKVYENQILANKDNYNTGKLEDTYKYGEFIGTVKAITNDKLHYVLQDNDTFSPDLVWVKASDVIKF